jgi:hypothetical protein
VRRPRLTYANVISTIALFVALGGTSYAVARNSIGTAQLKTNAVTSAKVKNGSLRTGDLAPAARIGQRGPRGPQGPPGAGAGAGDLQPEAWQPLGFIGGWGNYPTNPQVYEGGSFRKDKLGDVHLRGLVSQLSGLAPGSPIIAVLPPGYRPKLRHIFASEGGNPDGFQRVDVTPDGAITWLAGGTAETDFTTLDGISFSTD